MSDTSTLKKAEFLFEQGTPDNWEANWMKVQYNPENFSMNQTTSWEKQPASGGSGISPLQFQSTEPRTITMDLLFDMTVSSVDAGDVYSLFIRRFLSTNQFQFSMHTQIKQLINQAVDI